MTTWIHHFIGMTKALSRITTWEKRGIGKILYSVRWYRSFSLDRITSNPFHAELIIIVNITFHYIVFSCSGWLHFSARVHFFTLNYNNSSQMGSYWPYRTYLNFPHHRIEMKQHFCKKYFISCWPNITISKLGPNVKSLFQFIEVWLMTFGHKREPHTLAAMGPKQIWHTGHLNHKFGTIWILFISPKKRLEAF